MNKRNTLIDGAVDQKQDSIREASRLLANLLYSFPSGSGIDALTKEPEPVVPEAFYRYTPNVRSRKPRIRIIHASVPVSGITDQYYYFSDSNACLANLVDGVWSYERSR